MKLPIVDYFIQFKCSDGELLKKFSEMDPIFYQI